MKRITKIVFISIVFAILLNSCNKNDEAGSPSDTGLSYDVKSIAVIDISQKSDFDEMIIAKGRNDLLLVKKNNTNPNIASRVLYKNGNSNKEILVLYKNNGNLDKIILNDYIIIINNINGNIFDAGIVYPNGDIDISRNIDFNHNLGSKNAIILDKNNSNELLYWLSNSFDLVSCVASAVETAIGNLNSGMLDGFNCGIDFGEKLGKALRENGVEIYVSQEFYDNFNIIYDSYKVLNSVFDCVNNITCINSAIENLDALVNSIIQKIESDQNVYLAASALEFGYGDVQVTLSWDNKVDLDLHVVDPNGEEIFYDHNYSVSNGSLDVDDIDGFGPENIFWPTNQAPSGTYEVYVHQYPWDVAEYEDATGNVGYPNSSNYTVLVNAFGFTKKYTGSISYDEKVHIANFNENGIYASKNYKFYDISVPSKN